MSRLKYITEAERSELMKKVKSSGTKGELLLGKILFSQGIRFRKNVKDLPGKPDFAIKKYKIAVFVDGEFWHGKDWEIRRAKLKKNRDYWIQKIERNMQRDIEVSKTLNELDYKVFRIWAQDVPKKGLDLAKEVRNFIQREKQEIYHEGEHK